MSFDTSQEEQWPEPISQFSPDSWTDEPTSESWAADSPDKERFDGYACRTERAEESSVRDSEIFRPVPVGSLPPCLLICWSCHGCLDSEENREKNLCPYSHCSSFKKMANVSL